MEERIYHFLLLKRSSIGRSRGSNYILRNLLVAVSWLCQILLFFKGSNKRFGQGSHWIAWIMCSILNRRSWPRGCGFLISQGHTSTPELAVESDTSKTMDLMALMFLKGNSGWCSWKIKSILGGNVCRSLVWWVNKSLSKVERKAKSVWW